jgi:hypothetical protein
MQALVQTVHTTHEVVQARDVSHGQRPYDAVPVLLPAGSVDQMQTLSKDPGTVLYVSLGPEATETSSFTLLLGIADGCPPAVIDSRSLQP